MNANNGQNQKCQWCGHDGHTAHDLSWNESVNGWLCEVCRSFAGIDESDILELDLTAD